jgi:D-glycero-alpha-D-manno-heptose-7-phosphate kinase
MSAPAKMLAEHACKLEMNTLKEPIGKQDQYAAAYGGLRRYLFNSDGSVFIDPVILPEQRMRDFYESIMLFYVGGERKASDVLSKSTVPDARMRALVDDFWNILTSKKDIRGLGEIFEEGWITKKRTGAVTSPRVDELYDAARFAGAGGGKLLGAGGAGFLMLFCTPSYQREVRKAFWKMGDPRWIPFKFEPEGSKIVHVD